MQLAFGSGSLWGVPSGSNPTPSRFGVLQNAGIDFTRTSKPLFGLNQLPVAVGVGAMQVKGKAAQGRFSGRQVNDLFFGGTSATGQTLSVDGEAGTIPGTPFQITVANSGTFGIDLGVVNSSTGVPLTRVASSPATGQYSVSAGVYTFAAADTTLAMKLSYTYTTTGGQTVTLSNQAMGIGQTFKVVIATNFNGNKSTFTMNAAVAVKWAIATQLEDFTKPDLEFDCYADSTDTLGTISFAEVN